MVTVTYLFQHHAAAATIRVVVTIRLITVARASTEDSIAATLQNSTSDTNRALGILIVITPLRRHIAVAKRLNVVRSQTTRRKIRKTARRILIAAICCGQCHGTVANTPQNAAQITITTRVTLIRHVRLALGLVVAKTPIHVVRMLPTLKGMYLVIHHPIVLPTIDRFAAIQPPSVVRNLCMRKRVAILTLLARLHQSRNVVGQEANVALLQA